MIRPVTWQTNESGHHDLSTAVKNLSRDVDKRQSCYVEQSRHAGNTRRRNMCSVKLFRQNLLQSGMPYRPHDWGEGTVQLRSLHEYQPKQ